MRLLITCKCGHDIKLKPEHAGKKVRCSKCRAVIFVAPPRDRDDEDEPLARVVSDSGPVEMEFSDTPAPRQRALGPLVWIALGSGLLVMAGAAAVAVYLVFFNQGPPPGPGPGTQKVVESRKEDKKVDPNEKLTRVPPLFKLAHPLPLNDAAISRDGQWIATVSDDGAVLWDATGKEMARIFGPDASVKTESVAFAPDSKILAVAFGGGLMRFWDLEAGKFLEREKRDVDDVIRRLRYSPDGNLLAVRFNLGTIKVFHTKDYSVHSTLPGDFREFAFSSDSQAVLAGGVSALVRWDLADKPRKKVLIPAPPQQTETYFTALAWSPVGPTVAFCDGGGQPGEARGVIMDFDFQVLKQKAELTGGEPHYFTCMAFSPDGKWLATGRGSADERGQFPVELWEVATGKWVAALEGPGNSVLAVAFADGFTRLVAASKDRHGYVWDLKRVKLPE